MNSIEIFERELSMIKDEQLSEFAKFIAKKLPAYFFLVPSSSTGKYHSQQSQGTGGLVRHSKAVVYFADIMCRAFNVEGKDRDKIIISSMFHDCLKYGLPMQKWTTKTHDKESADFVFLLTKEYTEGGGEVDKEDVKDICKNIAYHMGRWTTEGRAKKFPEEYTLSEKIVHLADMMSAGKEVSLGFLQENLIG